MRRTVMMSRLTVLAVTMLAMLAFASPAWAATFTVDRSDDPGAIGACTAAADDCSLRQAISSANGAAGADTIDFAPGISTVTLTTTGIDNNNTAGDLDITDDLTIDGGTSGVIIEGGAGWSERVIDTFGAATTGNSTDVTIADATIRNGNAIFAVGSGSSFGGGIRVNANATLGDVASLTLRRSTVTDNHADQLGGGIYDEFESDITLEDSTVSNNTSGGSGGIHVRGSLTMANSTISGNEGDVLGGGISAGGGTTVTMTESTMSGNTAKTQDGGTDAGGGGIYMTGATVTLTDSTVSGNIAEGCALCRGLGGGIYVDSGTLDLANTTFSGNTAQSGDSSDADGEGGGIYRLSGETTLSNSTVSGNTAGAAGTGGDGGGVFSTNLGSFTFRNSILALNNADLSSDLAGTFASQGYNLLGENPGILDPTDIVNPVPLLDPLADNGGSTMTHALQTGSPAIDAANPAAPGSGPPACEATDQRGVTRAQGPTCDIGAFEREANSADPLPVRDDQGSTGEAAAVGNSFISQYGAESTSPTRLNRLNTAQRPYTLDQIGNDIPSRVNAIGYRSTDHSIYGYRLTSPLGIVKIDPSSGATTFLGNPRGLPSAKYIAGDVSPNGSTYYLYASGSGVLRRVALTTMKVTSVKLSAKIKVADLAVSPLNNNLYGVAKDGKLLQVNPRTGKVTLKKVAGLAGGTYGATWFTAEGDLIVYENGATRPNGTMTWITSPTTSTPRIVSSQAGPPTNGNDGAAYVAPPDPAGLSVVIDVLANDGDESSTLDRNSLTIVQQPADGTATIGANQTITYTSGSTYNGTDSFRYEVCDTGTPRRCGTATVNITSEPVE